jgi:2-keto-4-pentenoate hydratase/2-oxohepta-3-ene-1,7-dioic acid hydratase in catechol pathway
MKFVRFLYNEKLCYGKLKDNFIFFLNNNFLDESKETGEFVLLKDVKLLSPVAPSKIIAVGLNYFNHIKEFGNRDVPTFPTLFAKMIHTVIGQHDAIIYPGQSKRVDFEAEMALVISKQCKNVTVEEAGEYIFGVTCLNDVTARDLQKIDGQWMRAKNYETFCPIGPCIATDLDYNNLNITSKLNGVTMQHGNTINMIFKAETLVSLVSGVFPLEKGDIITTGTPEGVAPMQIGDIIEIELEGVGTLRNILKSNIYPI